VRVWRIPHSLQCQLSSAPVPPLSRACELPAALKSIQLSWPLAAENHASCLAVVLRDICGFIRLVNLVGSAWKRTGYSQILACSAVADEKTAWPPCAHQCISSESTICHSILVTFFLTVARCRLQKPIMLTFSVLDTSK